MFYKLNLFDFDNFYLYLILCLKLHRHWDLYIVIKFLLEI